MLIERLNDQNERIEQIVRQLECITDGQKHQRLRGEKAFLVVRGENDDTKNISDQTGNANDRNQIKAAEHLDDLEDHFVLIVFDENVRSVRFDFHAIGLFFVV